LGLAALGLPVFPCSLNKRPSIAKRDGGNGFHDAVSEPDAVRALWGRANGAELVGVPTGWVAGFFVIDIDPDKGGADWEQDAISSGLLIPTRMHTTPRGGRHYLYRYVHGVRCSEGKIAPGVDVRGADGYVCYPPSGNYRVADPQDVQEAPDELLELITAQPERDQPREVVARPFRPDQDGRRAEAFIERCCEQIGNAGKGQKHWTLRRFAATAAGVAAWAKLDSKWLKRRLEDALPYQAIVAESGKAGIENAKRTIGWAVDKGWLTPIPLEDRPGKPNGQYRPQPPPNEDERQARGPEPINHRPEPINRVLTLRAGWAALQPQELGTVVQGLLHIGSVTLIYGQPKSGKSFLATDLGLTVSGNRPDWMGHRIVRHGPVLYVACEGHAGFWKRLEAYAKHHGMDAGTFPPGFILATGRPSLLIQDENNTLRFVPTPEAVLQAIDDAKALGLPPVAVVVDTVFRSFGGGNVNSSQDMNAYQAALAVVADRGVAVALVHHETKSNGSPAGSVSLMGGADTLINVRRKSQTSDQRVWEVPMAKDDAETAPRGFRLEVVTGLSEQDGEPTSSCVMVDTGPDQDAPKKGRPKDETSEAGMLAALVLRELENFMSVGEHQKRSFVPGMRPQLLAPRRFFRSHIWKAGLLAPVPEGASQAEERRHVKGQDRLLNKAIMRLKLQGKVLADDTWVGLVYPPGHPGSQ